VCEFVSWSPWAWRWYCFGVEGRELFLTSLRWTILGAAILPSLSYLFVIFAARSFFRRHNATPRDFPLP